MSDEPKKRRSRKCIGRTLLAILLAYPLAMRPAFRLAHWAAEHGGVAPYDIIHRTYAPIFWLSEVSPRADAAFGWYLGLWLP
jgi:hypothetical protein